MRKLKSQPAITPSRTSQSSRFHRSDSHVTERACGSEISNSTEDRIDPSVLEIRFKEMYDEMCELKDATEMLAKEWECYVVQQYSL